MTSQSRILVIDDDQRIVRTIKNVLSLHGYDVCVAENGAKGIEKAFEYNPDLILCDVRMEPIDGFKVLSVLKNSSINYRTPFIFFSGNSDASDIRFGIDMGADDFLLKPIVNDELIKSIENQLNKYRSLIELGKKQFEALFELSPNYIFLFDGDDIFNANTSFMSLFKMDVNILSTHHIQEIFDVPSYDNVKHRIKRCASGVDDKFNEQVKIVLKDGSLRMMDLYVAQYQKHCGFALLIALLIPVNTGKSSLDHLFLLKELLIALKSENIIVSDPLGRKLSGILKGWVKTEKNLDSTFFSKRELQVLQLTMEGLPIKQIAERLLISDRTVERHRANVMEKTNSATMIEVIVFAVRNSIIDI